MKTLYTGIVTHDNMANIQLRYGPDVVCTPLIEIMPVANDNMLREAADNLADYDYLLFTSHHAVKYFSSLITHPIPPTVKVVSIGTTTTASLHQAGFSDVCQTDCDNSYAVIRWFGRQTRGRVLIPRSDLALSILPDGLRYRGFQVTTVTAYHNRMPANPHKVDLNTIDRIVFTSPSTITHFISLYGPLPTDKVYETRGPITRKYFETQIKIQDV